MESGSTLLLQASWPAADLGQGIRALAVRAGLVVSPLAQAEPASFLHEDLNTWMRDTGGRLGVELVQVSTTFGELADMLRRLGPSLLRLPGASADRFLIVLRGGSLGLTIVTPELRLHRLALGIVLEGIFGERIEAEEVAVSTLMDNLGMQSAVRGRELRAFAHERLSATPVLTSWLVRPSPASDPRVQARSVHLPLLLTLILGSHALSTVLSLLLWWLIGRQVFADEGQGAALASFAACLLVVIPLRLLEQWAQSRLTLDAGASIKKSLLYGVLQMDRGSIRGRGIGQFLGMAMEGDVSSTVMQSAMPVLISVLELVVALVVLTAGAGGAVHGLLLLSWLAVTAWLCKGYAHKAQARLTAYRKFTHDLVECLVGYQTRLVQERPDERDGEEDALLHEYLRASQAQDTRELTIDGMVSSGWLILGTVALVPALAAGAHVGPALAIALGGVLMAARALKQLVGGVKGLVSVWVAWQQTAPILKAGQRALARDEAAPMEAEQRPLLVKDQASLLRFENLSLKYTGDAKAVLRECSQEIRTGDRILLEGPSGGGKSTLAMVLSGMRAPDSGMLFMFGERSAAVAPARWRSRAVLVPQFHDNYILTESLLFNLLLGRRWPPLPGDEAAALATCRLLGLEPLLNRMPQGLAQTVGDGGWALSHGERSRVFLARALLQEQVELIILDESFAALDPATLRLACQGVLASAPALLVIAHP